MKDFLSLIKFSHTIFALPFAILGYFLGSQTLGMDMNWKVFVLVILCMVFARSAAMAFNRYLDRDIDQLNPRTRKREIPDGVISPTAALNFVVVNSLFFILTTWFINYLCFYLSPLALAVILGYSYTKRFTPYSHFVLGLGLSLAPLGAYLAVTGAFNYLPVLFSVVVFLWVSGFDIIYALQDAEFDAEHQLKSIPVLLGKKGALRLSSVLHFFCALFLIMASYYMSVEFPAFVWLHWLGSLLFVALLIYQHLIVKPNDLSRVNLAFFTTNGVASIILGAFMVLDIFI